MVMRRFLIQNGKLGVALLVIFSVASLLAFRAGHSEFIASPETAASAPLIKVSTSLGDDVLTLTSMTGKEEISRLFHFELENAER